MPSPEELRTLDAALARIVPTDADVRDYVFGWAARRPDEYRAAALLLESRDFASLAPEAQDATLAELEAHPSIALLIQHAVEGRYVSPAGFEAVGFRVTA